MQAGRWKTAEMVGRYTAKQGARQSAAVRVADRRGEILRVRHQMIHAIRHLNSLFTLVHRISMHVLSRNRSSFMRGFATVLACSLLPTGLFAVHSKPCFAAPDSSSRDFSPPLIFSSKADAALEERKAVLVKILDDQKKAGRLRLVDAPLYRNSFDGCVFHRTERVTYHGQSFGGTNQTTTSEVEITFDVTTLTKIQPSVDIGPPDLFSVIFDSDAPSIDIKVEGTVFHHSDQLIAVDDERTAQLIVGAFNDIANSCKARQPAVGK